MTQAWVVLTAQDGKEIAAPTDKQLAAVLSDIFGKGKAPPREPASATLRFGYDDGLMYAAEVSSSGELRFEEWSDRDCELALARPRRMQGGKKEALEIWTMLARRQVSRIRELDWS
jgi:hypothetical protein